MKITLAQIGCVAGDAAGNASKIIASARQAKASSLVIFPELTVSGPEPYAFLKDEGFIAQCEQALDRIAHECETIPVLVGCPVRNTNGQGKPLFNAAVYMFQGQRFVFKKKQLSAAEAEFFEPSDQDTVLQVGCHKYAVTIGDDLSNTSQDEFLLSNRVDELMPLAPDVILNISAEKCGLRSSARRRNDMRMNVLKCERPLVFVNAVADKKEATYDGGSMIFGYESYVVASAPFFEESVLDVNLECLISMRHVDEQEDYTL